MTIFMSFLCLSSQPMRLGRRYPTAPHECNDICRVVSDRAADLDEWNAASSRSIRLQEFDAKPKVGRHGLFIQEWARFRYFRLGLHALSRC
jgi:hypothetical protein